MHLGFFPSEEEACRAYDRSAINKGSREGGRIVTNKDINNYISELEVLRRIKEPALVEALSLERLVYFQGHQRQAQYLSMCLY